MVSARRAARLQISLELLDPLAVPFDNLLDVSYPVKINLELVELAQDLRVPGDLRVGAVNDVARPVVLDLGEHLRLLTEVADVLLYPGHQPVKVSAESREGRAVEQQQALAASSAGGPGARRASAGAPAQRCLTLAQELDFLRGEAQLRVRYSVGRHGEPARKALRRLE